MSMPVSIPATIAEQLFTQYGPLLTLQQLATILNRSYDGLRLSLRSQSEFSEKINATRIRLGRRVYFRVSELAKVLEGGV